MIYWNVSVPLLAAVTTGGTVLLPCGITYEEYREDLLSYGYTPLKCEREEYNYNSKEIDWKELCKSKVGAKPQTHYPFARWKQPVSGHVFKVPVNLSLKKDDIPIALLMLSAPTNTEALKIRFEAYKNKRSEITKKNIPLGEGVSLVRDMFVADTMEEAKEKAGEHRSEERRVGKECRSRWSPYH